MHGCSDRISCPFEDGRPCLVGLWSVEDTILIKLRKYELFLSHEQRGTISTHNCAQRIITQHQLRIGVIISTVAAEVIFSMKHLISCECHCKYSSSALLNRTLHIRKRPAERLQSA
jgi:hypothetical protein